MKYLRVVRFTDVDPERMSGLQARIDEDQGPPEGVTSSGIKVYHDADQNTAVVIQIFDSMDDMASSEAALDGMDPGDTPGTRASVDRCELKAEANA
jgi:hypothetical protein